ncbi:hypothetical protein [Azospirillum rugosum]|uniref:Stress-induced acidophilic repeat motif-containing protein n=1 Tax=Azospirillum rugosum TaxID=416170 RepID=A0ABS4SQP9_9PROT|nr:hypothetical protein [Azospirillum rugosum]MBP2294886.1 hypothetical protein [Azospirillum rugosum]MDQ0528192.1 hypothetical protein [Azospirillum rugosum]
MSRSNHDTEQEKHQSGGPGKAAKAGHVDPDKAVGNKPGQNQSGSEGRERGSGSGGARGASDEQRNRSS